MLDPSINRRHFSLTALGATGLSLFPGLNSISDGATFPRRARSCIIVYLWGGIAHQESWDPKPDAKPELRGEFNSIPTATPGVHFSEHLPRLAKLSEQLAVVRSLHHEVGGHGGALYGSITGDGRPQGKARNRKNWPSVTAMISRFRQADAGTPHSVCMPYLNYDNGSLIQGQFGGWLGGGFDPLMMKTPAGRPYAGTSRYTDTELDLKLNQPAERVLQRQSLRASLEKSVSADGDFDAYMRFRNMASDMLLSSPVNTAYQLDQEDPRIRVLYGDHIGGQSFLLARRLIEAGVPVVQINAGAGDLAGGNGDNWDTHRDHFPKMKNRLLPVLDQSLSALLMDLDQRGMLDETLVAVLTDFGRTPKINNNGGRDHYPAVYSQLLAGGGIRGGVVYGESDPDGVAPAENACAPADFHATMYQALGINPKSELEDMEGRPFQICQGEPLPLF